MHRPLARQVPPPLAAVPQLREHSATGGEVGRAVGGAVGGVGAGIATQSDGLVMSVEDSSPFGLKRSWVSSEWSAM